MDTGYRKRTSEIRQLRKPIQIAKRHPAENALKPIPAT